MAAPGAKRDLLSSYSRNAAPKRSKSADCCSPSDGATQEAVSADFECSICLSLLCDPVVGQCGHDFCSSCLQQWVETSGCSTSGRAAAGGASCPVCRQQVVAPGAGPLGICHRLQKLIERQYPRQLAERRAEVEAQAAERARARQQQQQQQQRAQQEQIAAVQDVMRARMQRVSLVLQRQQQQQQPTALSSPSAIRVSRPSSLHNSEPSSSSSSPSSFGNSAGGRSAACGSAQYAQQPGSSAATTPSASPTSSPSSSPTWQRPAADVQLRELCAAHLLRSLSARRPDVASSPSAAQRLPSLVAKLEEVLYRTARSRDEYADPAMLEARVNVLVRQLLGSERVPAVAAEVRPEPPVLNGPAAVDVASAAVPRVVVGLPLPMGFAA